VSPEQSAPVVVEVRSPLLPAQARQLCDHVDALLLQGGVICELHGIPDAGVLDALARMHLAARRLDAWLRVRRYGEDLIGLLDLTGLATAVPGELETGGQPEAGEQRGVEEVVDVPDPSA
jgi:hypothetical protein